MECMFRIETRISGKLYDVAEADSPEGAICAADQLLKDEAGPERRPHPFVEAVIINQAADPERVVWRGKTVATQAA